MQALVAGETKLIILEKSKGSSPVLDCDNDDVLLLGQARTVQSRIDGASSATICNEARERSSKCIDELARCKH